MSDFIDSDSDSIDISNQINQSDSTPEQAAGNLYLASNYGVPADQIKDIAEPLQQSIKESTPVLARPIIARQIAQAGPEAAKVIEPNLDQHNGASDMWGYYKSLSQGNDLSRSIAELATRKKNGEELSVDDKLKLADLNDQRDAILKSQDTSGLNWFEKFAPNVEASLVDTAKGILAQKVPIMLGTAAGGLIGSTVAPVLGTASGAITGFTYSTLAAMSVDQYQQMSANLYNDFDRAVDDKGQPLNLPQSTKVAIADGTAAIATLVGTVAHVALGNLFPGASSSTAPISKYLLSGAESQTLPLLTRLGRSSLIGAINGGSVAAINILGHEIAQSYDGTQASFWGGVSRAIDHWDKNVPAVASATAQGAAAGAQIGLGAELAHAAVNVTPEGVKPLSPEVRDVTPAEQRQLGPGAGEPGQLTEGQPKPAPSAPDSRPTWHNGDPMSIKDVADIKARANITTWSDGSPMSDKDIVNVALGRTVQGPSEGNESIVNSDGTPTVRPTSDLVNNIPSLKAKGLEGLQRYTALQNDSDLQSKTAMAEHAPDQLNWLRKALVENAGAAKTWVDQDDAEKFSGLSAKKAALARKILGDQAPPDGAPYEIDTHDFLKGVDEDRDFAGVAKVSPEGMSHMQYAAYLAQQDQKRKDLLALLPQNSNVDEAVKGQHTLTEEKVDQTAPIPEQVQARINNHQNVIEHQQEQIAMREKEIKEHVPASTNDPIAKEIARHQEIIDSTDSAEVKASNQKEISELTPYLQKPTIDEKLAKLQNEVLARKATIAQSQERINELKRVPDQRIQDSDIFNEQDYLNQETFTKAQSEVIPQKTIEKANNALRESRKQVVDALNDAAHNEMNKVMDVVKEIAMAEVREEQAAIVASDPNIQIVEKFQNNQIFGALTSDQEKLKSKGIPILAIDPSYLTLDQRNRYVGDLVLKSRKVFHGLGIDPVDVATVLGVRDVDTLLQILSRTPSRKNAIENQVEAQKEDIALESERSVDLNETAIIKAYHRVAQNHLLEMKIMRQTKWPALKGLIKTIFLPMPRMSDLAVKAQDTIADTRVSDLNVNQYKVGERKAQSKAMKSILNLQTEQAFVQKEAAAQNAMNARETHLKIGEVNRGIRFAASLKKSSIQRLLKNAGPLYQDPINNILDVFNFDPTMKNKSKVDAFQKYTRKMAEEGQGDARANDIVPDWITGKTSAMDLTVGQFLAIIDEMKAIVLQARMKDQIIRNQLNGYRGSGHWIQATGKPGSTNEGKPLFKSDGRPHSDWKLGQLEPGLKSQTMTEIADIFEPIAKVHAKYDERNFTQAQGLVPFKRTVGKFMNGIDNAITNIDFTLAEADQGVYGGPWSQLIGDPIRGLGNFAKTGTGRSATKELSRNALIHQRKLIRAFRKGMKSFWVAGKLGIDSYDTMGMQKVYVPEFANIPALKNGNVTKLDLHEMLRFAGNQGNMDALTNFGVDEQTLMKVFERHLEKPHFDLAQGYWDMYQAYAKRLVTHERNTTGRELELTIPKGFTAHGVDYRGGHYPIRYLRSASVDKVNAENIKAYTDIAEGKEPTFYPDRVHDGIVYSPHTKERVGSDWVVDLSPFNHAIGIERLIYDLTMRIPVRDTMKLLNNKRIANSLTGILGQSKYKTLVTYVAEATNSNFAKAMELYSDQNKTLSDIINYVHKSNIVANLALNLSVTYLQPVAIINAMNKMGIASSVKYLSQAALRLSAVSLMGNWDEMYKFAIKGDPSIADAREGMDMQSISSLGENMPVQRKIPLRAYYLARNMQEASIKWSFHTFITAVDTVTKVIVHNASYNQFVNGDAPGHSLEKVNAMTPEELDSAAHSYAGSVNRASLMAGTTLDKSAIQKLPIAKIFSLYMNISRNSINTNLQGIRSVNYDRINSRKAVLAGDRPGSIKHFRSAGDTFTRYMLMSLVTAQLMTAAHGRQLLEKPHEYRELSPAEQISRVPNFILHYYSGILGEGSTNVLNEMFGQHLPGLNEILYAKDHLDKHGLAKAMTPLDQTLSDVATTGATMNDIIHSSHVWFALTHMEESQAKAAVNTIGLLIGGNPTTAEFKIIDYMKERAKNHKPIVPLGDLMEALFLKGASEFISKNDEGPPLPILTADMTLDEKLAAMDKAEAGRTETQQAADQLKEMVQPIADVGHPKALTDWRDALTVPTEGAPASEDFYQTIAMAESHGGKVTNVHGRSSAKGKWQIVSGTWGDIAERAPKSLGLKADYDDNTDAQVESGAKWYINDIAKQLRDYSVPVTLENVYGSYMLGLKGFEDFLDTLKANPKASIKSAVSPAAIKANKTVFSHMRKASEYVTFLKNRMNWAHGELISDQAKRPLTKTAKK